MWEIAPVVFQIQAPHQRISRPVRQQVPFFLDTAIQIDGGSDCRAGLHDIALPQFAIDVMGLCLVIGRP